MSNNIDSICTFSLSKNIKLFVYRTLSCVSTLYVSLLYVSKCTFILKAWIIEIEVLYAFTVVVNLHFVFCLESVLKYSGTNNALYYV